MVTYSSQRYRDDGTFADFLNLVELRLFGKGKFEMLTQSESDRAAYEASAGRTRTLMLGIAFVVVVLIVGVIFIKRAKA